MKYYLSSVVGQSFTPYNVLVTETTLNNGVGYGLAHSTLSAHVNKLLSCADSTPFLVGSMLYLPFCLANPTTAVGGCFGVLKASIGHKAGYVSRDFHLLDSDAEIQAVGLRISQQCTKMFKSTRCQERMFDINGIQYVGRGSHNVGFKTSLTEVLKGIVLGYVNANSSVTLTLDALCSQNHNLSQKCTDGNKSLDEKINIVLEHFQEPAAHPAYAGQRYEYYVRAVVSGFSRTSKDVDPVHETSWRKASKNSKWPYTLDHHWFQVMESAVVTANYSLQALLPKESLYRDDKRHRLQLSLPTFSNGAQLEKCRKALELYFTSLPHVLRYTSAELGRFTVLAADTDWPEKSNRYGRAGETFMRSEGFIVKACLALGVIPTFNSCNTFVKFAPINGTLHINPKTVYYKAGSTLHTQGRSEMAVLLAYSVGLINLEVLEKLLGPLQQSPYSSGPTYMDLRISGNVVCCIPVDMASVAVQSNCRKSNLTWHPTQGAQTWADSETGSEEVEEIESHELSDNNDE